MPEPREARSIIESAEQAAAAGDYASAEDLLREAAALQEQTLGPQHPELANTLNNLGVVCEMTDNPIDAEHYFRRAHSIATASLPPDHPFVVTSSKNLHDFCAARGRPVELPPSPPAVAAWLEAPAPPAREASVPAETRQEAAAVPQRTALGPLAIGALGAIAVVIVILAVARPWGSPVEETNSPAPSALEPARQTPAPAPPVRPSEPIAQPQQTAKPPDPIIPATEDQATAQRDIPPKPMVMPTVAAAQVCTALNNWRCQAAEGEVSPGQIFFFTQVKSPTATTIEHRWYQGDRFHRAAQLRIEANPGAGYRTYSRTTISSERAGEWRVELRAADGTVLHEARFTVR
jgi:hypothetical protein